MAVLVAVVVLSAAVFFLASDAVRAVAQHGPPTPQPSAVAAAVNTLIAGVERTRAAVTASAPRRTATSTVSATWTPTFTVTASPSPTPTFTASPTATHTPTATTLPTPTETPRPAVLIGAGDISVCGLGGDFLTAALIERLLWQYPWAQVFTAGDNAQSMGTAGEYNDCFHQSWGRFKDRIRPSPGNHDWYTDSGGPYFDYFGEAAGPRGLGYYSYDLGDWHIVSLNSACDGDDHCSEGTAQAQWLRDDLSRNQGRCTLLYWHHPEFSSGTVPYSGFGRAFWQIASDYGADVVVNGHDHHYERFAPMDRDGQINYAAGTRVFIAATGGAWRFELGDPHPATEARDKDTLGALVFKLYPGRYEWQFVPVDGGTFMDSGVGGCR